jgi:glucuronosyltransferase
VVYVSFGTIFIPQLEDLARLIETIKMFSDGNVGFMISLKKFHEYYDTLEQINLPHVYLSDWLPQREILNHQKTKLFITHCGANGVIEGMYYGVAMLGFPL